MCLVSSRPAGPSTTDSAAFAGKSPDCHWPATMSSGRRERCRFGRLRAASISATIGHLCRLEHDRAAGICRGASAGVFCGNSAAAVRPALAIHQYFQVIPSPSSSSLPLTQPSDPNYSLNPAAAKLRTGFRASAQKLNLSCRASLSAPASR